MSESRTSTSTSSANAFPRPAGATLLVPDQYSDQLSPARSTFSFEDSPKSPPQADSGSERHFDHSKITRAIDHGAPGEKKGIDATGQRSHNYSSRRRTQFYEEQFQYKDTTGSARERVTKDSPVIAELRTNVIIKDEYTLVTDLSYHLSTRYQRPESSIMITVNHSACLLLGGSFEPAYILTVTALPVQIQPTTNKRNAALIQSFMSDSLGVTPDRGIIKFQTIPEENMAINGRTILGEIERLEKRQAEENGTSLKHALTKGSRRSVVMKSKSSIQLSRSSSKANGRSATTQQVPPSPGIFESGFADGEKAGLPESNHLSELSPVDRKMNRTPSTHASKQKKPTKTTGSTTTTTPRSLQPPPIPEDAPIPKIGKRKSFIAIFRR
ncbi:hypothetical protein K432DRAFT_295092 [Lepidopterella palustris CBS 459.81]|uniref:L-dopachrome isomerase n=1 Tax=Lepidopterella palustris CBS 459.81 TaxID=1314670 RepID=A0A8E2JGG5_9PEZI|nr:hypothetical protein K432DRAFT_295092 [Lepidopterella palustris CBS 459.81]